MLILQLRAVLWAVVLLLPAGTTAMTLMRPTSRFSPRATKSLFALGRSNSRPDDHCCAAVVRTRSSSGRKERCQQQVSSSLLRAARKKGDAAAEDAATTTSRDPNSSTTQQCGATRTDPTPATFQNDEDEDDDWRVLDEEDAPARMEPPDSSSFSTSASSLERLQEATEHLLRQPLSCGADDWNAFFPQLEYLLSLWPRHARYAGPRAGVYAEHLVQRCVLQQSAWQPFEKQQPQQPGHRRSKTRSSKQTTPPASFRLTTKHYTQLLETWARVGGVAAAERAELIHAGLVREWQNNNGKHKRQNNNNPLAPTVHSYNALLTAWKTAGEPQRAPVEAERILREMCTTLNSVVVPDSVTLTTILELYAQQLSFLPSSAPSDSNRHQITQLVQRCEALVEDLRTAGSTTINCWVWAALQTVHARSRLPDAADKAEAILQHMLLRQQQQAHDTKATTAIHNQVESESDESLEQQQQDPHIRNYNAVLNACSKHPTRTNIRRALHWLRQMEQPDRNSSTAVMVVRPDRVSYALVILTCARGGRVDLADRVLGRMEVRAQHERAQQVQISSVAARPKVTLEVESYNVILLALSTTSTMASPQGALALLQRMQSHGVQPNVRSWNAILNTLARASSQRDNSPSYVRQAERILEQLSLPSSDVKPNEFTYSAVLSVYMRSGDPDAAARADALVGRMEDLYKQGELASPPDRYHYTTLTNTYARSTDRIPAARRVLELLMHMWDAAIHKNRPSCRPNTRTYNSILDCLIRAGELERAEELLYHALGLYRQGDTPAAPDLYSFNSVIAAFTRSRRQDAGSRAESILDRLVEYSEEENPAVLPDARSFNLVLSYYAKSKAPDSSYRADYMLNRMINRFKEGQSQLLPLLFSFTSVVESYASASHPDAGTNADRLIRLVRGLNHQNGARLEVNTSFMNSALFAWASCGAEDAGSRVEVYLDEMEAAFETGRLHLAPDTRSYGLALSAWSKSTARDKHRRALDILRRMERQEEQGNRNVKVDEHARSLVINACGFSNAGAGAGKEAFDIAVSLFDQIMAGPVQPTALSFGWFIQACGRIQGVPDETKEAQIAKAFLRCCEAGLVNDFILNRLRGAASEELYRKLLQPAIDPSQGSEGRHNRVSIPQLPFDWKRNSVVRHKRGNN